MHLEELSLSQYPISDGNVVVVNPGTFTGSAASFSQLSVNEGIVSTFETTKELAGASTSFNGVMLLVQAITADRILADHVC